jgi:hypothetical protein
MGRRKTKAGRNRHRAITIRDLAAAGATVRLVPADAESAGTIEFSTGENTGARERAQVVGSVGDDHQMTPEPPVENIDSSTAQLMAEADAAIMIAPEELTGAPGAPPAPAGASPADMEAG